MQCNYLVVRCFYEAHDYSEAMRVLNSMTIDIFQQNMSTMDSSNVTNEGYFDDSPKNVSYWQVKDFIIISN